MTTLNNRFFKASFELKKKVHKPKPQLLHVKDENGKTAFTIKTHEGDLTNELINQCIERARYSCVGPPIFLNLVYHDGSNLGINRKVEPSVYWEGHDAGDLVKPNSLGMKLRRWFSGWITPYWPEELELAKEGKW